MCKTREQRIRKRKSFAEPREGNCHALWPILVWIGGCEFVRQPRDAKDQIRHIVVAIAIVEAGDGFVHVLGFGLGGHGDDDADLEHERARACLEGGG